MNSRAIPGIYGGGCQPEVLLTFFHPTDSKPLATIPKSTGRTLAISIYFQKIRFTKGDQHLNFPLFCRHHCRTGSKNAPIAIKAD